MRKACVSVCAVACGVLLMSACAPTGPVKLSLGASQLDSGENRAASDSLTIAPEFSGLTVDYTVVGTLDSLPSTAQAWSVGKYGEAMRETQRIADALGVNAKAKRSGYDDDVFVAEDKVSGATVTLWNHLAIGGWWSYSSATSQGGSSAPGCPPDDRECVSVAPPAPPANLINNDEALARTNDYLTKAKFKPADYVLTAQKSEWSTDVNGVLQIDGVLTNVAVSFSYGENGVLNYASGPMMSFTPADTYPLVGVEEAVQRLAQPKYGFFGMATKVAADVAVSDVQSSTSNAVPLSIPLTSVRLTLMESNLGNGTHILLPAFTFANADGDVGTVIAVTDEYLIFPEPTPPPSGDPGVPEPAPGGTMEPLTEDAANTLIGLTEDEAAKVAAQNGWVMRIAKRDGEEFALTMDYRTDRINVSIEKNIVIKITIG